MTGEKSRSAPVPCCAGQVVEMCSMRRSLPLAFLGLVLLMALFLHLLTMDHPLTKDEGTKSVDFWPTACPNKSFALELKKRAGPKGQIILALVDTAFADMALNLYLTSFAPYNITNFLFVGAGKKACIYLAKHSLPCFTYTEDKDSSKSSTYLSPDFLRKMNIRTFMIIDALNLGFTVLHTDLDMVFLKNPLPYLNGLQSDIATLWDDSAYNAGFVLVRPTKFGKEVYQRMRRMTSSNAHLDDQNAMNRAISQLKREQPHAFKVLVLDVKKFKCGLHYFENEKRLFPGPCPECVVVHNNWIVSKEAKIYRFKEHFMWSVDEGYYSSPSSRYLLYDNIINFKNEEENRKAETGALATALAFGQVLNRSVILPQFHCGKDGQICPLNGLFNMHAFDAVFGDHYREHSFLKHPKVPTSVTSSLSLVFYFKCPDCDKLMQGHHVNLGNSFNESTVLVTANSITSDEVIKWLGKRTESVLRFHSLYHLPFKFSNDADHAAFQKEIEKGLKKHSYRQL